MVRITSETFHLRAKGAPSGPSARTSRVVGFERFFRRLDHRGGSLRLEGRHAGVLKQPEPGRKIGLGHHGELHMRCNPSTAIRASLQENGRPEPLARFEVCSAMPVASREDRSELQLQTHGMIIAIDESADQFLGDGRVIWQGTAIDTFTMELGTTRGPRERGVPATMASSLTVTLHHPRWSAGNPRRRSRRPLPRRATPQLLLHSPPTAFRAEARSRYRPPARSRDGV